VRGETYRVRKVVVQCEEIWLEGGRTDPNGPLRRVVAAAVIANPYAGRPWSSSLEEIVQPSAELARLLGGRCLGALDSEVEGYGKAAIVGSGGEQEHAVACLTSVFGDALRDVLGGATAWLPSTTKRAGPGAPIDIPTAYRHALWVRSHYDTATLTVADAPLPDEILVAVAVTNRGRLNARLGGLAKEDVRGEDALR
jgi:hypothetical protein